MIGELFLHEYDAECLNCRVPNKCDQSDDRCGIKRGVKYGIYPLSALKSPSPAVCSTTNSGTVGFKSIPLFEHSDGMYTFAERVAGYKDKAYQNKRFEL